MEPMASSDAASTAGVVYLVGAGPGDPGLLTLRGRDCLAEADLIVYDYLANPQLLRHARADAEIIYAGKKAGQHAMTQEETSALLVREARTGRTVVRLKGGDPFVFGRGGEEAQALAEAGVRFEIVPGISSTVAGPAYAGIPVTHRDFNRQLTIFTGHEDPAKTTPTLNYAQLAATPGTRIMLMGMERLGSICDGLLAAGAEPSTPVALVRWATTPRQETLTGTLQNIAAEAARQDFRPPAVVVIGDVVGLREKIAWFDRRPLFGRRIVVTRTRQQAGELSRRLERLGADILEIPTIRIGPPPDPRQLAELIEDAHRYDWIIFTSPNGVDRFMEPFFARYRDIRSIGNARFAVIGHGTAARLAAWHLEADVVASVSTAEGLLDELLKVDGSVENRLFLLVRPAEARNVIATGLTAAGAIVDEAVAYRTEPETEDRTGARQRFLEEGADVITFASSSAVENFLALQLPLPPRAALVSIGPITTRTLREHGLEPAVEAATHDIDGLVRAVLDVCQQQ